MVCGRACSRACVCVCGGDSDVLYIHSLELFRERGGAGIMWVKSLNFAILGFSEND